MMSDVMVQSRLAFWAMGVSTPVLPKEFADKMDQISDVAFSSKPLQEPLYHTSHYIQEAVKKNTQDYLAFGVDGYGMFSHYFHYYLVQGGRSIFLQAPVINDSGARNSITAVNEKLDKIAQIDEQAAQDFSIVDVIGASYIVHGSIADSHARVEFQPAPLDRYLSELHAGQDEVSVIRV